ncbi:aquaporin-11 [Protopterus annectens]|uniref:aquaporin-11 n=1 Tax=Protopterus annectens TaxID=7888 RepID=UPI001CF989DB|nr:aquaporin-11 [Protopterus annectens]
MYRRWLFSFIPGHDSNLFLSLTVLTFIVVCCEVARRFTRKALAPHAPVCTDAVIEFISTFQLCACSHELRLLSDNSVVDLTVGLSLIYIITVVHGLTFDGALCNPTWALERTFQCPGSWKIVTLKLACQFAAAVAGRVGTEVIWSWGLSELHQKHLLHKFKCWSGLHTTVLQGAAVELACTFTLHATVMHLLHFETKYRVHFVAAIIAVLVYAGGSRTGAAINPALAYSLFFHCTGNSFQEYVFVYWVGPVLGMVFAVMLLDRVRPQLSKQHGKQQATLSVNRPDNKTD